MRISKILVGCLAGALMVSCSDSNDYNSASNVIVAMQSAQIVTKESKGLFYVPIVVTGEPNGPIKVEVSVKGEGNTPATEDVNYYITSRTVNIPEGEKIVNVEISPVDDEEINEPRQFVVTIASADGATIGTESSCVITIRDNDAEYYEKLQGAWNMNYTDGDKAGSFKVNIAGADEEEPDYNNILYVRNIGTAGTEAQMFYEFDMDTKEVTTRIPLGQSIGQVTFSAPYGLCDVVLGKLVGDNLSISGELVYKMSSDAKKLELQNNETLVLVLFKGGEFTGAAWYFCENPNFVK